MIQDEYKRALSQYIAPPTLARRKGYRMLSPEEVEALPDDVKEKFGIPRQAPDKE